MIRFFRDRPRVATALLFVLVTFLSIGVVEATLRIFMPLASSAAAFTDPQVGRYVRVREHLPNSVSRFERDGTMIDFRIDSNGFIEPSNVHRDPKYRIVFLGGSTTETIFVPEAMRFPYLAGRLLESELSIPINAYNGGVSGSHSIHLAITMLAKVVRMQPDVIVFMENMNDVTTTLVLGDYWTDSRTRGVVQNFVGSRQQPRALVRLLLAVRDVFVRELSGRIELAIRNLSGAQDVISEIDEFEEKRGQMISYNVEFVLARQRSAITTFIHMAQAWGIRPILMTQGNRLRQPLDAEIEALLSTAMGSYGLTLDQYIDLYHLGNENIRQIARAENVKLIDLDISIPKTAQNFYDAVHLTAEGSRLVALIIAEALSPIVAGAE